MSLGVYNSVAFREAAGLAAVAPLASIEVRREDTAALASIFSDVAGAVPLGNPFLADSQGRFKFYAAGIALGYQVKSTLGADVVTLRNVAIGTAMYLDAAAAAVTSVNTRTGAVVLDKTDVGLANVDNTSDAAKPVSTAQQTALNLKANLASPTFTGVPAGPTAAPGTDTTQFSTTAFVKAAIDAVRNGVAAAFDTLAEIATELALKATLASPTFTGNPAAPTQAALDASTKIATTAYADAAVAAAAASLGRYIQTVVLTSGTSFTTNAATKKIRLRMVGGGAGGGGCTSVASAAGAAGGGGAGGYAEKTFTVTGSTAYTYAIGAAGTGVSAAAGNNGGNTTFTVGGTTVTASGGLGGPVSTSATTLTTNRGGFGAGISTNGDLNSPGDAGTSGYVLIVAGPIAMGGKGGSSHFAGGALGQAGAGDGAAATGLGCGGAGAVTGASAARAGGAGIGGCIVVDEFS